MRVDWNRHVPLGLDGEKEIKYTAVGLVWAALWAQIGFISRFSDALEMLYYHPVHNVKVLQEGAVMEDFFVLMGGSETMFCLLWLCMTVLTAYHYWYHRQGAMPVYLMRRLPDRWEYHRRCLTIPVVTILASLALMGLIGIISYGIYISWTPAQCLPG